MKRCCLYTYDLAEWSKVNFLYNVKTISQTRQLLHQSHDKKRFTRLLTILEQETGHTLLAAAEETKIALTNHAEHREHFDFLEKGFYHRHGASRLRGNRPR